MSDDRDVASVFVEGLEPVMEEAPPAPEWEWLRPEPAFPPRPLGQWWVAAVAAVTVILVGVGSVVLIGGLGDSDDAAPGEAVVESAAGDDAGEVPGSIEGRWVLESWEENGERIVVEEGVNTTGEPWIEFTPTPGEEPASANEGDGASATTGSLAGSTGCNQVEASGYEYSAGFLVIGEALVTARGCEPNQAEEVLWAMLSNTPDGIEVVMDGDRMEWFGSNLEGTVYPLMFRRDGAPDPGDHPTTTAPAVVGAPEIRVYDVDGVEVVTPTHLGELPERATTVEFNTTVIDSGDGPEVCVGLVAESLPPQCSGPVAAGLDMAGWSEEQGGVRWGDRSVVVTWPPVDGVVEVIGQSAVESWDIVYPSGELPEECRDVATGAGAGPINAYARSLGDSNGGVYVANDGTLVLQVVGDPAPHREALAERGGACVVAATRSEAEQLRILNSVHELLADIPEVAGGYSASSTGPGGRIEVQVPVADQAIARAVADLVDDPTAIRLIGTGILAS